MRDGGSDEAGPASGPPRRARGLDGAASASAPPRARGAGDGRASLTSKPPTAASIAASRREAETVVVASVQMTRAERHRTALLFALLFLVALVFVVGRSTRDALFLTKFPVSWIGPMWMAYGGASSLVALLYARFVDRLPRVQFTLGFGVVSALAFVTLRVLIGQEIRAAYAVLYVVTEILANLAAMLAWTIAHDLHDARSGKRLFGLIGAGRVAGVIVCGFGTAAVVRHVGTANLLLVVAAAMIAFGLLGAHIARVFPAQGGAAVEHRRDAASPLRSRYVGHIALLTLVVFAMLTIGDYQFKAIARTTYPRRDELAGFMANFQGAVGAAGLLVQLFVTPRLLRRYGVLAGLLVLPLIFSGSTVGLLLAPGIAFAALLKASDNGLQYTIHDASMQLLLFPFAPDQRGRVLRFVDAIVKPLGRGVGALVLVVLTSHSIAPGPELMARAARLGVWTLPLGAVMVLLVPIVRRGYVEAMKRTLVRRDLEPELLASSPQIRDLLRKALLGPDAPQVLFAIEQLRGLDPADADRDGEPLRDALPALATHASRRVRAAAVRLAGDLSDPRAADFARAAIQDAASEVRVAAVETLAKEVREDAHDELVALADGSDDVGVRTAAIAALVRFCGLDGMLDGAPRLRALLDAPDAAGRVAAARVLELVGEASLQRALARLLMDDEPAVRLAAVVAAAKVGDVRLLPLLVDALEQRRLASAATRALAALGPLAVADLGDVLADASRPRAVRLAIPRILARIATAPALAALLARIDERDDLVRQKVLASASRLRLAIGAPPSPFPAIRARIDAELREHVATRDGYVAVRPLVQRPLLDEQIVRRLRKGTIRVMRLIELAFPRQTIASVRAHLFSKNAALRANAFEVLESLVDRGLREQLIQIVDRVIQLRAGVFPAPPLQPREAYAASWLADEIGHGDPYGAALALDAIAHHRIAACGSVALGALGAPDPLVREAAAIAVAALRPAGYQRALAALAHDADDVLRAFAAARFAGGDAPDPHAAKMLTTVEKILYLQRVPLFARVAGDDLVSLARGAVLVSRPKGSVVFRQGESGGALYLVLSGRLALDVDGRVVADLGANDVFGEMSIFDQEPRASTATIVEDAELLLVSAEDFHEAVRDTVEIAEAVIQVLNRRLREADRRLAAVAGKSPAQVAVRKPPPEDAGAGGDDVD